MTGEGIGRGPTAGGEGPADARIDSAVGRLDQLEQLPVHDHVEQYERIHAELQDVLSSVDEA